MNGTTELKPDQLADLVSAVFQANGYDAYGLSLYRDGQLVGFDRAVVHHRATNGIEVFQPPAIKREDLDRMLYPNDRLPSFRENVGTATS